MRRWIGVCIIVGLVVSMPAPGVAEGASPWTKERKQLDRLDGKFYYGLKNLLWGWTEVFTEPDEPDPELNGWATLAEALTGSASDRQCQAATA